MGIRTKIVATVGAERPIHGPDDRPTQALVIYRDMVCWFVEAGVDVFRLNMSHRSPSGAQERAFLQAYRRARHLWERQGQYVAIMGDLQGPKIRIGDFYDKRDTTVKLEPCKEFTLYTKRKVTGNEKQATVFYEERPFTEMIEQVQKGDRIWLGDGEVLLEVRKVSRRDGTIQCHILYSKEEIKGRRGVTVQGKPFDLLPSFTEKDQDDLRLLLTFGDDLTYVAISFVKTAENILEVRCFIEEELERQRVNPDEIPIKMPGLIAKIETPKAVEHIEEILDVTDGIMVARGDLRIQNLLQTQGETDRISHAACNLSVDLPVAAIIAPTTSGQTTRMVARFRPKVPIVGAAHDYRVARKLTLCFGVHPVDITDQYRANQPYQTNEQVFEIACKEANEVKQPPLPSEEAQGQKKGYPLVQKGDLVVITAGHPLFQAGTTNLVKLHKVN